MTNDEIKEAIRKGFQEHGLIPDPWRFLKAEENGSLCGCAQGAAWIGSGRSIQEYTNWTVFPEFFGRSMEWCDELGAGFGGGSPGFPDDPELQQAYAIGQWARGIASLIPLTLRRQQ